MSITAESKAGPGLDSVVVERVFGRKVIPCDAEKDAWPLHGHVVEDGVIRQCNVSPYSGGILFAWEVAEELAKDGCIVEITLYGDLSAGVEVFTGARSFIARGSGDSAAHAICLAALAAKERIATNG